MKKEWITKWGDDGMGKVYLYFIDEEGNKTCAWKNADTGEDWPVLLTSNPTFWKGWPSNETEK